MSSEVICAFGCLDYFKQLVTEKVLPPHPRAGLGHPATLPDTLQRNVDGSVVAKWLHAAVTQADASSLFDHW